MMFGLELAKQQQIFKVSMIRFASSLLPDMATFEALVATLTTAKKLAIKSELCMILASKDS